MKTCPFCAEPIQDAAIVCKHCGRDLRPRVDPLLAPVQGKSAGNITVVGYMGIGLGVVLVVTAAAALLTQAGPDQAGSVLFVGAIGVGIAVSCYLWVRR